MQRASELVGRPGFPDGLSVLLLESDGRYSRIAEQLLVQCNYSVTVRSSVAEAITAVNGQQQFDLVLSEAHLLLASGDSSDASKLLEKLPLILMAEKPSPEEVTVGVQLGAAEFMEKPLSILKLKNIWQHTVRRMMRDGACNDGSGYYDERSKVLQRRKISIGSSRTSQDSSQASGVVSSGDGTFQEPEQPAAMDRFPDDCLSSPGSCTSSDLKFCLGAWPLQAGDHRRTSSSRRQSRDFQSRRSSMSSQRKDVNPTPRSPVDMPSVEVNAEPAEGGPGSLGAHDALQQKPAVGVPCAQSMPQLQPGMEWGMPLNKMSLAPGITPPIFPAPLVAPPSPMLPPGGLIPSPAGCSAAFPASETAPPGLACFSQAMAPSFLPPLPPLPMHIINSLCGSSSCLDDGIHPAAPQLRGEAAKTIQPERMPECFSIPEDDLALDDVLDWEPRPNSPRTGSSIDAFASFSDLFSAGKVGNSEGGIQAPEAADLSSHILDPLPLEACLDSMDGGVPGHLERHAPESLTWGSRHEGVRAYPPSRFSLDSEQLEERQGAQAPAVGDDEELDLELLNLDLGVKRVDSFADLIAEPLLAC